MVAQQSNSISPMIKESKFGQSGKWKFQIKISQSETYPSLAIRELYRRLALCALGEIISVEPPIFPGESLSEEKIDSVFFYELFFTEAEKISDLKLELKKILSGIKGISEIKVSRISQTEKSHKHADQFASGKGIDPKNLQSANSMKSEGDHKKTAGSMRVDMNRIEELVNLIGELIISRNQVDELIGNRNIATDIKQKAASLDNARIQLDFVTNKLRDLALGIRMVPISQTLKKYNPIVRDIARRKNKEIELIIEGGETELDKAILEEISDPLLHIVRNAADHGIESKADRELNGKSALGHILIRAAHEGDRIVVIIEDDGKGLDSERISQKALEMGLLSHAQLSEMSEKELFNLIFHPGFSTADKVTDLSGRGVGLDVVLNNIMRMNGVVEVESGKEQGTRFTLKLPLTLSILDGLLIEDGGQIFAVPLISIEKAFVISHDRLRKVGRYWLMEHNQNAMPVFRLAELMGLPFDVNERKESHMIEAVSGDSRFGLLIDKIVGKQEIVIKSLGDYLGKVNGVTGATILGNGRVSLIIDIKTIADSAHKIMSQYLENGALGKI